MISCPPLAHQFVTVEAQLLTINEEAAGARLDSFLASRLAEISRTRIQRAIEDGDILVNERAVKSGYRLRAGDQIEVDLPEPPPVELLPEPIPLEIVYEDDDLIVVDKPAGMVAHPGAGIRSGTLANALVYHFDTLSETAGRIRPGIVHRIDKETSGLLVVAKNDYAHERLSDQFRDRLVFKKYVALVYGRVLKDRGEVEAPIGRSPNNRTRMAVVRAGAGRTAHTLFDVARRFSEFTLLNAQIKTGRTHQIRVHLAHINHPVVGDVTYGGGRENSIRGAVIKRRIRELGRHFLHSAELAFNHPRTGERLEFSSPLPPELAGFIALLD
ncbi:MAG TPA: RluA family pseudouridine synthase [Blastocatellia bacterium]|nr:RluA family pseudouridine synthase [Blastocatellia bacterium]